MHNLEILWLMETKDNLDVSRCLKVSLSYLNGIIIHEVGIMGGFVFWLSIILISMFCMLILVFFRKA